MNICCFCKCHLYRIKTKNIYIRETSQYGLEIILLYIGVVRWGAAENELFCLQRN